MMVMRTEGMRHRSRTLLPPASACLAADLGRRCDFSRRNRRGGQRGQHQVDLQLADVVDREAGDERAEKVGAGPAHGDVGIVAGAVFCAVDAADDGLQRDAEHLVRQAQHEGRHAQHAQPVEKGRQEQRGRHGRGTQDHRQSRLRPIGKLADDDRQQHGAKGIKRDDHADRELIGSQLQGMKRHRDTAAAEPHLAQNRDEHHQVNRHAREKTMK
jgi:hypothetical protein